LSGYDLIPEKMTPMKRRTFSIEKATNFSKFQWNGELF